MPTVSVIVPVYKVESYLSACVDSILCQSMSDFELILIDDGSPDRCGQICDEYAKKDDRIIVIHQKNQGLSGARNSGMDIARGEYITFVDSDDIIGRDYLKLLYEAILREGVSISSVISYNVEDSLMDTVFAEDNASSPRCAVLTNREALLRFYNGSPNVPIGAAGKMFSREVLEDSRFPVGRLHEDQAFMPPVIYRAGRIVVILAKVYYYRIRSDSITHTEFTERRYDDLWAIENCIRFFENQRESEIVEAAKRKRQRLICIYAIFARRYSVKVPKEYRISTVKALCYLRKNVSDEKFDYCLAQVEPKLVRPYAYIRKARRLLSRRT